MTGTTILPFGLRRRLMTVFLLIILTLSILNAFNLIWISMYFKAFSRQQQQQVNLQEIISNIRDFKASLYNYSRSANPSYLEGNKPRKTEIHRLISEEIAKAVSRTDIFYTLKDISMMIDTLYEEEILLYIETDRGIETIYLQDHGDGLARISDYIIEELQLVVEHFMHELSIYYQRFSKRITLMNILSFTVLIFAMFMAIYTARRFVLSVTLPVHQLAMQLVRFG
ncbi:MAG: hypothetical protein KAH21_09475, partial [Spirochaetaceae bacterium]|nr:hypothetical protein [Spirochaetaceae bacterium]